MTTPSLVGDEIQINFKIFGDEDRDEILFEDSAIVQVERGENNPTFTIDPDFITSDDFSTPIFVTVNTGGFGVGGEVNALNGIGVSFFNPNPFISRTVRPIGIELLDLDFSDFGTSDLLLDEVINGIIPVIPTNATEGLQNTSFSTTEDSVTIQIPQSEISNGGANVGAFLTTECFLAGTKILTGKGEIAVEELSIGDLVQTAEGKLEPVKWIGKQTVEPDRIKNPLRGYPILIKAGALGHGLPHRDLYTSPDHAYLVDGLLINAGALVNDVSIIKTEPTETFCYYHVELENHSLLLAEGTAAESFYPNREDRQVYDNGAEYDRLYPYGNSQLILYPLDYPRISSKNKVPGYISEKLLQIAEKLDRSLELVTARS
ncbi:MAG: Hint domain-containing protein [Cyanobacteria bacterium J06631_2]